MVLHGEPHWPGSGRRRAFRPPGAADRAGAARWRVGESPGTPAFGRASSW